MNTINLNEMSVVELKALAYDVLVTIEQQQKNLQNINQALQIKSQPTKEEVGVEKPEPTA